MSRNKQIEGLRGLAIFLIVVFHIFDRYRQIYMNDDIVWMNQFGMIGNTVFMLITGYFLISIVDKQNTFKSSIEWLKNKVIRLWPTYFVAISLIFIVMQVFPIPGRICSLSDFLLNTIMVNNLFGANYVDGAHWYLSVLIWVLIVITVFKIFNIERKYYPYYVWLGIVLIIWKFYPNNNKFFLGGTYSAVYCFAIALRRFIENSEKSLKNHNNTILLCASLISTVILRGIMQSLCIVVCSIVIWACVKEKLSMLECRMLRFLGVISYSLFLCHQNISFSIIYTTSSLYNCPIILMQLVCTVFSMILGFVIYKTVERPVRKLIWGGKN